MVNLFDLVQKKPQQPKGRPPLSGDYGPPQIRKPIRKGLPSDPAEVQLVREALTLLGYDSGHADSTYLDAPMEMAIRSFQKDNRLRVDGYMLPDGETSEALEEAVLEKQRARHAIDPFDLIVDQPKQSDDPDDEQGTGETAGPPAPYTAQVSQQMPVPKPQAKPAVSSKEPETGKENRASSTGNKLPPEKAMGTILKSIPDDELNDISNHKGETFHIYKDTKNHPTIGKGHKIDSVKDAQNLPLWVYQGGHPSDLPRRLKSMIFIAK